MNSYISFLIIFFIVIFTYTIINLYQTNHIKNLKKKNSLIPVYCLMITGKDEQRFNFAKIAIKNFLIQSYKNKYLIIINEGNEKLINKYSHWEQKHILEIIINRKINNLTLGDLRNISLQYVPPNAIWTTWDDDDWRHVDYITILYNELIKSGKKYLMYKNRIDHNFNTNFKYRVHIYTGGYIFFMFNDPNIYYDSLDTKEDMIVKKYIMKQKNSNKVFIYDNDPKLYIRFIHKNNTSLFIDPSKKKLITNNFIKETNVSSSENIYVNKIITTYYHDFL